MKAININKLKFVIFGVVTAGLLLGMALQAEAQVPFTISASIPVSSGVGAVATGDFNNDGKVDLVVASRESNMVSLLLGNGAGSFGAPSPFSVGDEPSDLTTGDFNNDGNLDLAVANGGTLGGTVSILLGTGSGSFEQPRTDYTVGSRPMSVAAGYLDNDAILDLATANFASADVSILLGTENGAFAAATNIPVGSFLSNPRSVEMGDLDGDGNLDLSVAEASDNTVSILWGDGDGSFGSPTDFASIEVPVSLAIGDVNGDGYLDIAVANNSASADYVTILFGDINGSFAVSSTTPAGQYPLSVSMSDFDRDGNLDLLVGKQFNGNTNLGSNEVSLLLGDGTGAFGSPVTIFSLATSTGFIYDPYTAIGDFNGDNKPDVAVADPSADSVTILLNNPVRPMPWIPLLLLGD